MKLYVILRAEISRAAQTADREAGAVRKSKSEKEKGK